MRRKLVIKDYRADGNHSSEILPHRRALARVVGGDPSQRSINSYAKKTPGITAPAPTIVEKAANED